MLGERRDTVQLLVAQLVEELGAVYESASLSVTDVCLSPDCGAKRIVKLK